MRSATRRGLTTVTAFLVALGALLWAAAPAQAHTGVNVALHTDGAGKIWGVVTYADDGHPVTGSITAVMLATSPDGKTRVGPFPLQAAEGQQDGVVTYQGQLKPGDWRVSLDVAAPGIANCVGNFKIVAAAGGPAPQQQVCAASFWPTAVPAPATDSGGGSLIVVAVIAGAAVLSLIAIWIAMRSRRDRDGGPARRPPTGPRERTGATQARPRSR